MAAPNATALASDSVAPSAASADPLAAIFERTGVKQSDILVVNTDAASIPVIDAHNHLNGNTAAETLIAAMDRAGVKRMVLMPRHYTAPRDGGLGSDEQAIDYARRYPGRFIPFIGGQRDDLGPRGRIWNDAAAAYFLLQEFENKLKIGGFFGLGEFILVHHAYDLGGWGETGGELRLRPDSHFMREVARIAAKYDVPVLFHAEAEPDIAEQVARLLDSAPNTRFIWAHNCGRGSTEQIRRFLVRYPKLMCDLGAMFNGPRTRGVYGQFWPRKTPWIHLVMNDNGGVFQEMKALFEAFPDRFIIGTDTAHTHALKFYQYRIIMFRVLLAQLSPDAARKIGFENAERLFQRNPSANRSQ